MVGMAISNNTLVYKYFFVARVRQKWYGRGMTGTPKNYTRVMNRLLKIYYPAVATKVLKKQIEMGLYPIEFLQIMDKGDTEKNNARRARQRFNNNLKLKNMVWDRDEGKCVLCGVKSVPMDIDHIKPLYKFPELAQNINNLRLLCKKCHQRRTD
jgi:hypothetical protein